jgi:cell division protein FtsL
MEKFNFTLSLIVLGLLFSVSIIYAEMTKESSGNDITGKKSSIPNQYYSSRRFWRGGRR